MADLASPPRIQTSLESFEAAGRRIGVEHFQPLGEGPHPALVLLHGADGLPGRSMAYRDLAARFATHGYRAFLLHYFDVLDSTSRPSPLNPVHFAAWMMTIREGIGYALAHPETASARLGLLGVSLGGYLAVAVGSQDTRVGAIVECCGGAPDFFLRAITNVPPVLILHGEADLVVPISEARKLERKLRQYHRPHETWIYPGGGHRLSGPELDDAFRRSLHFLARHLPRVSS